MPAPSADRPASVPAPTAEKPASASARSVDDAPVEVDTAGPTVPTGSSAGADMAGASAVGAEAGAPTRLDEPAWARPALVALLVVTAVLYLWSLSANRWANEFYAAAVQAGSVSWKAFLFGSSDAANTVTVDKPPASLWPAALAVRMFGLSSWSLLVPQALMGVATVAVVHAAVRRSFGAVAGLLAGAVLAFTPVAALMFRFDNPDALLTLLLAAGAYTALRAIEEDRTRWYVLTGVAIGLAFLTKQLQALLVVPGFTLALLVAGAGTLGRRVRGLLVAGAALVGSAGWWVALVELRSARARPYIGGSEGNSFLDLTFGYNGLGRITGEGNGPGSGLGPPGGGGRGGGFPGGGGGLFGGQAGIDRLLTGVTGTQASWLLPLAAMALVGGLVVTRRRTRTDLQRASLLLWGMWLLVTAAVFSFMDGIFHEYYTIGLAPAIGALVGSGAVLAWRRRTSTTALACVALTVGVGTWWAVELLGRAPDWNPWLRPVVLVTGAATTAVLTALAVASVGRAAPPGRWVPGGALGLAAIALLAGPVAWTLQTVGTARTGAIVTAGPTVTASSGPTGGFPGGGAPGDAPTGDAPGGGALPGGLPGGGRQFPAGGFPGGGGTEPSQEVVDRLTDDADRYEWVAATSSATAAAPYQLATERPVMPIGGFSGGDPAPTLEEFQRYVDDGRVHWFIAGSGPGGGFGGPPGGAGTTEGQRISTWVTETYEAVEVDGVTLYDLTGSPTG